MADAGPFFETGGEELHNALTHGTGFLLSLAGGTALVWFAAAYGDAWQLWGCALYAVTLVLVYGASTLSHLIRAPAWKYWLRLVDQAVIYLLIAGTYTPWGLVYLRHNGWWVLTAVMWMLALAGFAIKLLARHTSSKVTVWLYVLMGWLPLVAAREVAVSVPEAGYQWMLAGGVAYTLGVGFWLLDRRWPLAHTLWHLFVMIGSALHFGGVFFHVVLRHA